MSKPAKLVLAVLVVAALLAAWRLLPLPEWIEAALERVEALGPWGPVALAALYVVACVAFIPGSVLTLAAGALFGVWKGVLTVWVGASLGMVAAFLVGRYLARERVRSTFGKGDKRFAAIDRAVGQHGFQIVLLTRLSPVFPFNVLNYLYGVTDVSLRDYALASSLGILPGTAMYVYLGAAAGSVAGANEAQRSPAEWALFGVGLLAAVAVTVVVTRVAKKALGKVAA